MTGDVDLDVSDLWFDRDTDTALIYENGKVTGWDLPKLRQEAEDFIEIIKRLAPDKAPTVDDLLADFWARVTE